MFELYAFEVAVFLLLSPKAGVKLMLQLTIGGILASEKFNHNCQQYSQLKDSASLHVQCRVPKITVFPGVGFCLMRGHQGRPSLP